MFYQTKVLEDRPISYFEGATSGYLALINNTQRTIIAANGWSLGSCTTLGENEVGFSLNENRPTASPTTQITHTAGTLTLTSPAIGKMKDLKAGAGLTTSFHLRATPKTTLVEIKMQYNNGSWVDIGTTAIPVPKLLVPQWMLFSYTFRLDTFASALKNEDYRFVISITDAALGSASDYIYYINGLSVGQKSEALCSTDMGSQAGYTTSSLSGGPATLSVDKYNGLLTAVKSGIPLHRSLSYATLLEPYLPERPSLTLSKAGFMQEANKADVVTLEFWMKVGSVPSSPVRIVGPVGKRTGLYLNGTTLTLSIGNTEVGYDIGSIDYPMLIDWIVSPDYSAVLLNGEAVITSIKTVDTSEFSSTGSIGFYTDSSVHPVYVSSIATYQYAVPSTVAKIRFVRGQGTDQYGIVASKYDGKSHTADFSMADYATNITYPDNATWSKGISNNIIATDTISLPNYEVPELINTDTTQDWNLLNKSLYGKPLPSAGYYSDVFPLDAANDNTTGTAFTNPASNGEVYTTQTAASSRTNLITIPGSWRPGASITISGEAKFAGTAPDLIVTFAGPNTTYTQAFPATQPKSVATMTYVIPSTTTSITWGLRSTGGTTSGQFHNVVAEITYPAQPFYIKPTGYTTEPYLYWPSLSLLHSERTAAVLSRMKVISSPGVATDLITLRKRNTSTYLRAYLNGTTLTYEYNDYTGSVILGTKTVNASDHFNVGFDLEALATKYPNMSSLLGSPSSIEVLVGGGESVSFTGAVYHVSFYNSWHKTVGTPTYTDGLADTLKTSTAIPIETATYTLKSVMEYGNFTLDVSATGYWQETLPLSLFAKEVKDIVGNSEQRIDFMQATIGKSRGGAPFISNVPITYFQLINKYWGKAYLDMANDYASYNALQSLSLPTYDPTKLDLQTWVSLNKLSDAPVDYTKKTPMSYDGGSTAYVEDNGYRHFVQDGFNIVLPYTYDHRKYSITSYHILTSRGQRSSPVKLKSFELASWASGSGEWGKIGTQESNDAYPYLHNGSYYVMDFPCVFEMTKRGYNYLYKSNRSGFKPKGIPLPGYDTGMAFGWSRNDSNHPEPRSVAAVSMWVLLDASTLDQTTKIMTVTKGASQECYIDAVPIEGGTRFALQVKTAAGAYSNASWSVNGNLSAAPILRAGEWNAIQLAFTVPFDSNGEQVYVRTSGNTNFAFDHVTIHGQLAADAKGSIVYRRWEELFSPTPPANQWQAWGANTWYSLYNLGAVFNIDVMFDKMVGELTGTGLVGSFASTVRPSFDEIYVMRDIEWVDVPVISK